MPRYVRGWEHHCRCSGDFESRRIRVAKEWCAYIILRGVSLKICSQYDNCRVWLRNNYQKKYRYESKKHYLFKYDNCAWIYSDIANIHLLGKYDNSPECAWDSLWNPACIHLGRYEKGKVVFPRAVEIYAPIGEFHPAWSVRDLESTKIVLGNIQPKNCSFNLGSTII